MKNLLILVSVLAAGLIFAFCNRQAKYTPNTLPERQLRWGSGGGFTGKETQYTLLDNGQIFVLTPGGQWTELNHVKARKAKTLYESAETLGLSTLDFKHPGNIYSFIESANGKTSNRVTWGEKNNPVDPKIEDLFKQLSALVNQEKK